MIDPTNPWNRDPSSFFFDDTDDDDYQETPMNDRYHVVRIPSVCTVEVVSDHDTHGDAEDAADNLAFRHPNTFVYVIRNHGTSDALILSTICYQPCAYCTAVVARNAVGLCDDCRYALESDLEKKEAA